VWGIAGCDYGRDELAVNAKLRLPWSGLNPVITNTLLLSSLHLFLHIPLTNISIPSNIIIKGIGLSPLPVICHFSFFLATDPPCKLVAVLLFPRFSIPLGSLLDTMSTITKTLRHVKMAKHAEFP